MLVRHDKFVFPAEFIILVFEIDDEIPIILGRTIIDVHNYKLTMRVIYQQITFNIPSARKYQNKCSLIRSMDFLSSQALATGDQRVERMRVSTIKILVKNYGTSHFFWSAIPPLFGEGTNHL